MSKQLVKSDAFWHQSIAKKWGRISLPPIIPSRSELEIIRQQIKKYGGKELLVLGSTRQYRDLGHELNKEVTIVDISLVMMQVMSDLMKYQQKVNQETWVKANWLTMPLEGNHWDFVLGDFVLENVPLKLWPKFLGKIKIVLKDDGFFITRCWWREKFPSNDFIKIVIDNPNLERQWNHSEVSWLAHILSYNPSSQTVSSKRGRGILRELIRKEKDGILKKRLKKILEMYNNETPGDKTWWGLSKQNLEKMFLRYFSIIDIRHGNDHRFTQGIPVYILKKK